MKGIKKTLTTIFIVPTLKVPKDLLENNGFINGFIKDSKKEAVYANSVYLAFKPSDMDKFREFLECEYDRTTNILEDYDYANGIIVVVYKLNPSFTDDYDLVKQGKYSKTSEAFQNEFPPYITITKNGESSRQKPLQYRVFKKSQDIIDYWEAKLKIRMNKNMEIWEIYDEEKEILVEEEIVEQLKLLENDK
jgi:hypothetical protein